MFSYSNNHYLQVKYKCIPLGNFLFLNCIIYQLNVEINIMHFLRIMTLYFIIVSLSTETKSPIYCCTMPWHMHASANQFTSSVYMRGIINQSIDPVSFTLTAQA